jgi:hypothetical protein
MKAPGSAPGRFSSDASAARLAPDRREWKLELGEVSSGLINRIAHRSSGCESSYPVTRPRVMANSGFYLGILNY